MKPWRTLEWNFTLLLVSLVAHQVHANCFPAIFNFGDDEGDTGGIHASFPNSTAAEFPPYGQTYFGAPQGRNSDGRLIVDFIAGAYGLRFLDPYLQSVTSDFSQGVNFATWGAVARTVSYVSAFPLGTQVKQFLLFQKEVLEVLNETSTTLASNSLLGNISAIERQFQSGVQPYKKLYDDLFNNVATSTNASTNQSTDPIQRALAAAKRLPLADYFSQGLYLISIGTNDFKVGILAQNTTDDIMLYLPNVVTAVTTAVQNLYTAGARNIIVSGVGPIGCSPAQLAVIDHTTVDLDNWGCLADYNTLARSYNTLLQQALVTLTPQLTAANVAFLDSYQIQHNLLFNYTTNGFLYPIKACCGVTSTYNYNPQVICGENGTIADVLMVSSTCPSPPVYTDWDGIHYTEAANKYFANQIFTGQFFTPSFSLVAANCTLKPM